MTRNIDRKKPRCGECLYYSERKCKRYPPQLVCDFQAETTANHYSSYPEVDFDDWCGEFRMPVAFIIPEGFELI